MYDREVRSGNSRRKVQNKGGITTRRPSLTLLDPLLMNFRARVSHHHSPCRAAARTCRAAMELTYTTIRTGCIPPTVVISAPGLLVGSGMDTPLRGFLHAEPGARLHKIARSGALILRFRGGNRERSTNRRCLRSLKSATPADRTSHLSSSVVGACAARARVRAGAARCSAEGREKSAGQRGTEVRNKKEAACVLQRWDTQQRYCSCGRATTPATPALCKSLQRPQPCCAKKDAAGACACARAQTAVLVPAAACGNGAAAMQLRARARARTAAVVPEAARGDASASSRRRRAEQAKARE